MSIIEPLPIRGLDTAPEYFVEDIHDIQFCGVTTLFTPYRTVTNGSKYLLVPFTCRVLTGALARIERRLFEFAREHQLLQRAGHDDTRSV